MVHDNFAGAGTCTIATMAFKHIAKRRYGVDLGATSTASDTNINSQLALLKDNDISEVGGDLMDIFPDELR